MPTFFREKISKYAERIEELTEQRNIVGYGFEEGIGNEYFEEFAPLALKWAKEIVSSVAKVLGKI